jgi:hypothetical protein
MEFSEHLLEKLPMKSQAKVGRLLVEWEAAFMGLSNAGDQVNEARFRFNENERALFAAADGHGRFKYRIEKTEGPDGEPIYSCINDEFIIAHRAKPVLAAWRALQRAIAVRERIKAPYDGMAVVSDARDWLRDQDGPFQHVAVAAPAVKDRVQAVETIRAEIDALKERRNTVEAAPAPVGDLIAAAHSEVDRLAAKGAPTFWRNRRDGSPVSLNHSGNIAGAPDISGYFLIWAAADLVKQRLSELINQADDGVGVTDADRAAELADLDAKLLKAERLEEANVVAAADAGLTITRRREADPRALLELEIAR